MTRRPPHGFDELSLSAAIGGRRFDDRKVTVYLPEGYGDEPGRAYPVLYLQDGQNAFEFGPGGAGGGWDVARAIEAEARAGRAEPAIVVAIWNAGDFEGRIGDYAPNARKPPPDLALDHDIGGGADAYVGFVADVVRPAIERRYAVRRGPRATAIGGSSMGGLVALHAGLSRPEVFGKVLAFSPSVWFDEGIVARAAASTADLDVYLDSGGRGRFEADNATLVSRVRDGLATRRGHASWDAPNGKRVWHWFEAGHDHSEAAWRDRFPRGFRAVFAAGGERRAGRPLEQPAAR